MKVRHSKAKGVNPHRQRWCGPAAISALLGITVERATEEINRGRARRKKLNSVVKGSWPEELDDVARTFGKRLILEWDHEIGTVTQMLKRVDGSARYLVFITRHFFALKGRRAYDNYNLNGWLIRRNGARLRRAQVRGVYRLVDISEK